MNAAHILSSDRHVAPPPSILVVEDEVLIRTVVGIYLRDRGFHVVEAGTADEAIRVLESGLPVDLVFSDINMPGSMDGYGLAQWLRHRRPGLHLILTSGSSQRAADLGKHRPLLGKPYDHAELERLIRAMLSE